MDLAPRHRQPFHLPGPWPGCARGLVEGGAAWLHSGETGEDLLIWPGPALISTWDGRTWVNLIAGLPLPGTPWEALASTVSGGIVPWVGAASFELACDEASLPRQCLAPGRLGQHWMAVREALRVQDGIAELWSWTESPVDSAAWVVRLLAAHPPLGPALTLQAAWDEGQHRAAVERIQTCILDGEFYVANLCMPFEGSLETDLLDLAQAAFHRAQPPFGALLDLGGFRLLSLSMERLLSRRGQRLCSQPIKGSAPSTGDPELDRRRGETLLADPKERAEHTMILDLVRNDLGRVARTGTVEVVQSMALEAYPTVLQLVSTVQAEARPGLGLADLLRSVLPGGSVTGAPKHAVCRHLAQAEVGPRGFYCGAMGWLAPNGNLDLALPIRTAQLQGDRLTYWTGGGITRLSDPSREWAELHLKTRAILG